MSLKIWITVVMCGLSVACTTGSHIERGGRFGVRVGMPLEEAHAIWVRRGLRPSPPRANEMSEECGGRGRGPGDQIEVFFGTGWDSGRTYCLLAVDGRVAVIGWADAYL
jgi:hypothetical protein